MSDCLTVRYEVDGKDFSSCGQASENIKRTLKQMGIPSDHVRRVAIAMYEGEVNMVIHAGGGVAEAQIFEDKIIITLRDNGPGIANIEQAMQEGFSTAGEEVRQLGFGAGMGLPNMKKYSDDMRIESCVGEGTTVFLTVFFG